ncbi:hypothetical protein ACFV6U_05525 [Streptomyces sp. NPDC059810]|uniref:hypothetical protein n=1 Tax=Streptomyces sp. NPDC059810 TaxID=3346956 RepID=UPI00364D5D43
MVVLSSVVTTVYVYTPELAVISRSPSRMDSVMGIRAICTIVFGATATGDR